MESESKGYTIIQNNIFDLDLTVQEQSLYITIISFYNEEKCYAYPSYEALKQRSKLKDNRTLNRAMNSLVELNLIRKETLKGIGNKYFLGSGELHLVENSTTCKTTLPPSGELHYDLVENSTTTNTNINTNINTISSFDIKSLKLSKKVISEIGEDKIISIVSTLKEINKDVSNLTITKTIKDTLGIKIATKKTNKELNSEEIEMFNNLWSLYPNKKGISNARIGFKKLIYNYDYEELKRSVERFKDEMKDKELKYIKQGSTFFNTGYEDYLDKNYSKTSSSNEEYKPVSDNFD